MSTKGRRRLGELLIEAGVLDASQLDAALAEQKKWGGKLGRTLVELGLVDEDTMVRVLSRQLKLPVVDLDRLQLPASVTQVLTVQMCERYGVFPLGIDRQARTMQLATQDPTGTQLNDLVFKTGYKVQAALATGSSIDRAIRRMYYGEAQRPAPPHGPAAERPAPPPLPPVPSAQSVPDPLQQLDLATREAELARLKDRVAALERQASGQARALEALIQLLTESGLMSRDEYAEKAR